MPGEYPETCNNGIDENCDGQVDEDCPFVEPEGGTPISCRGEECSCNPIAAGDPVNTAQGNSLERVVDVSIPGTVAPLQFIRNYSSNPLEWLHDGPLAGAPKPFGSSPAQADSVEWWHNHLSVVVMKGGRWSVRDREGRLLRFEACAGTACQASPGYGNKSIPERLSRTASGFILVTATGEQLLFEAPFAPGSGGVDRYFLSRILSPSGGTVETLHYAPPGDSRCPVGAAGGGSGVPYLAEIVSPDSHLLLSYRALEKAGGQVECVLGGVSLRVPQESGTSSVPVVTYAYATQGGEDRPGRLASAAWADRSETYEYLAGAYQQSSSRGRIVRHEYGVNGQVSLAQGGGEAWHFEPEVLVTACQPGSNCCGALPSKRTATNTQSGRGDGSEVAVHLTRSFETLSNFGQTLEPRLYRTTDSCGAYNYACSAGTVQHEWACSTGNSPGYEQARKDKRNNWEVYGYAQENGMVRSPLEMTSNQKGATDKNGAGALETEFFTYTYGPHGEQLLATQERETVLGPVGERTKTSSLYEPGTTRKKAVIQSGWTRVRQENGSWTVEHRFAGTFFFTSRVALGETAPDPFNRTLEAHGPCFVANGQATDCLPGEYPLTQYHYWPETETGPRRNRLKSVSVYASLAAAPDVTTFQEYDAWGNVTSSVDANGVVTQAAYQEQRLLTRTVGSQPPTSYGYDQGRLSWIRHPEGNHEVFCYRKATPTQACTGGEPSEQLQWKAKAASADGAVWTEKVAYAYWADGTVKEERYLSWGAAGAETRRVVKFAADAHQRPAWSQEGEKPAGASSWSSNASVRLFDGADNLIGLGDPFHAPSAWCGGPNPAGTAASSACSSFLYDRANRLIQADGPSYSGRNRTCVTYDGQGNVASIKQGCPGNTACQSCAMPANVYVHDDFGQVVEVQLPDTEGPVRYAYGARGEVIVRETQEMRLRGEHLAYAYDSMGRMRSASRKYTSPTPGQQVLYRLGYGQDESPDSSCPQPLHTRGRLRFRDDSFGRTWFQYDEVGRLVGEIRLRAGTVACGGGLQSTPHTAYSYTPNGGLAQIVYPHGRTVTYVYASGAAADRISAVDVSLYDGASWRVERLLSGVAWEPYSGLRGYQLHHPGASNVSSVEYALGDDASSATGLSSCPVAPPSTASSDFSGRLRSLRVSSGALALGAGPGDIFHRSYWWKAGHVAADYTCLLGATGLARKVNYSYGRDIQLLSVTPSSAQGALSSQGFDYDFRGNRTNFISDGNGNSDFVYAPSPGMDRLLSWNVRNYPGTEAEFVYDADGRAVEKRKNRLKSESAAHSWLEFAYGPNESVATDSVFKAVSVGGVSYNYFYDALGRRRLKVYPSGAMDEFFYDSSHQLLTDQGNNAIIPSAGFYVEDDYIWLGGRPVSLIRGRFSTGWVREPDASSDCARNGESAACGVYFPITDHVGKPVLMLDASRKVAGIADYNGFGQINRFGSIKETAHPSGSSSYGHNQVNASIVAFSQPVGGTPATSSLPNTVVRMRVLFGMVDTEASASGPVDYAQVKMDSTNTPVGGPIGGRSNAPFWSAWMQPSNGRVAVHFNSNAGNCCPGANGTLDCTMTCNYEGVTVAGYEYRRFQTGAQPFWTPLRFPGQYHDEETDLLENWNRYYDPSIGRYLQPEPLLADPKWVKGQTQEGAGVYAYAYGLNNPLHFTDPDGRRVVGTADRNDWWNILQDVLWDLRSSQAVHDWFMACFGEDPLANDDEYRIHAPKSDWWCKARDVKAYTNWYVQETTLCRETLFDLPPAGPPGTQKRQLAETVMHELSHQVSLKTLDTPSYCGVSTQASQCSAEEAGQIGWNAVRR
ncbi:RHS repeat-associated core domain-containing protein [Stigmatella aurantiaca]|nr:RHS repeat-associated core domain-containing protein [Stigmatella aurantiaca]